MTLTVRTAALLGAALALTQSIDPTPLRAQQAYKQPPAPIAQMLDAEPTPLVVPSPDRARLLLLERNGLPPISEVAAPELRLAGERIDPRTSGESRAMTFKGLRVRDIAGSGAAAERAIQTPAGGRLADVMWSADGKQVAFIVETDDAITLWVADPATGRSRQLSDARLNATTGDPCLWISPTAGFACKLVVRDRGTPPQAAATPTGPVIQESEGRRAPNRTYEDLLENPHDESLFDYYFTDQVALIGLDGSVRTIGEPGVHAAVEPSPDGRQLLVETLHRPYSYLVPRNRFPRRIEVWGMDGKVIRQIADVPLQENVGTAFDAVPAGPRNVNWRSDAPATLVWAEALDGGDPSAKVARHDRVLMLEAPFTGEPRTLAELEYRFAGATWDRADRALLREYWWRSRRERTWRVNPVAGGAPTIVFDRSAEDRYADPGRFLTRPNANGQPVLLTTKDGKSAFLVGAGASAEGDRPFLDRIELATGKTTRLWRSAAPYYEEVVALLDDEGRRAITRRESVKDVPNYFVRDVRGNKLSQLTSFADPAPQFAGVTSQLITYTRNDGVQLSATLYLPAGYDKAQQGPLPFFLWAYPREFRSAAAAAQVQGSPYRFTRPTGASHLFLLTQGYGVLDGPTMPIVGEGTKEPNDSYVEQLVASAKAAVDKIVDMGVADRNRIAVGGHSYGAFMTANLLAHSDLFRAGIARSGAYNRTLTPFGFQQEERSYWQAPEIYNRMSPFNYADSIRVPVLLIHGMADDNSGTFPIQTERFYAALKGHGAKVRLVMLPAEAHGYRARESVGHTMWEMVNWLDTYVKPGSGKPKVE